jgi:hypothetical protein
MIVGLAAVASMMAAGCSGGSIGDAEGAPNVPGETVSEFLLEESTDTVARGRLVTSQGQLSFFALSEAGTTTLKVQVNGKTFDITLDASVILDGHDAVLTVADKALLQTLFNELAARFATATPIPSGVEMLANYSSYLSEAPEDYVHRRLVNGVPLAEGVAASAATTRSVKCIIKGKTYTAAYDAPHDAGTNACFWKGKDAGPNVGANTSGSPITLVDAGANQCKVTKPVLAGSDWGLNYCSTKGGDYSCMGRCGAGCTGFGTSRYSLDCLIHDTCSHDLCSSGGGSDKKGCADEYAAASDDLSGPCDPGTPAL